MQAVVSSQLGWERHVIAASSASERTHAPSESRLDWTSEEQPLDGQLDAKEAQKSSPKVEAGGSHPCNAFASESDEQGSCVTQS